MARFRPGIVLSSSLVGKRAKNEVKASTREQENPGKISLRTRKLL
jgi:hypothetical protein